MYRKVLVIIICLSIVISLFILGNKNSTSQDSSLKVAATIFPLYDITRNIAGDSIDVELILPPGASPHTFEPSPQEIKALQGSKAIFTIGYDIDNWSEKLAQTAGISQQITVDRNVKLIDDNPHYWLSVQNSELIADQVLDELTLLFPQYEQEFIKNRDNYVIKLRNLSQELNAKLASQNIQIATFHNAWEYFAQEYGIKVVAIFEEFPGKEPSPAYLADFQKQIQTNQVKIIFAEPQFSTAQLNPIATDLGVEISTLDPIGGIEGRDSYESLMRYNLERILEAKQ